MRRLSFRAAEVSGGERLERFERGVFQAVLALDLEVVETVFERRSPADWAHKSSLLDVVWSGSA
jgi:hypothetical protein